MAETPIASVIIPCYNGERTLAAAIDSALAQTYPAVEIVVVDDGSKDGSAEIARGYGDRIRLIQQPNSGLSSARNTAIGSARGKYIVLLDADDILLPECVARRVAILEADAEIGLVAGYYREMGPDGQMLDRVPEVRTVWQEQPYRQAVRRNWGPPVGWTFPAAIVRKVGGFDPLLRSAEDWDFVIRVSLVAKVAYDASVQALYRKSPGQMSSNMVVMLDALKAVQRKNRAFAPHPFQYWVDTAFGRFQGGRRILFSCLFESKDRKIRTLASLCLRYPFLIWVGALSVFSFAMGKRPSAHQKASSLLKA